MKSLLSTILLFAALLTINAQTVKIETVPGWDKLPYKTIHRIFQDSEGYMWYGTLGGLFRYDGYSFKSYRSDLKTPGLLENNYITNIAEDKNGNIWVGTLEGLYIINKETDCVQNIDLKEYSKSNIFTISITDDGHIWASIIGQLFELSPEGDILHRHEISDNKGAYFVYMTAKKEIIVSIESKGMFKIKGNKFIPYHYNPCYLYIERIIRDDKHNCYWLSTWGNGILKFLPDNPEGQDYVEQPLPVNKKGESTNNIYHMVQDDQNHDLWATTWNGLYCFSITPEGSIQQRDISSLNNESDIRLYEIGKDNNGNLWISSLNSKSYVISFMKEKSATQMLLDNANKHIADKFNFIPPICSICMDCGGNLWMCQSSKGIAICLPSCTDSFFFSSFLSVFETDFEPNYLAPSNEANCIWALSNWNPFICRLKYEKNRVTCTDVIKIKPDGNRLLWINQIIQVSDSVIIAATNDGLYEYNLNAKKSRKIKSVDGNLNCMVLLSNGSLWIASNKKALYCIDVDNLDAAPAQYPLDKAFTCMTASSDGSLWIGTNDGELLLMNTRNGQIQDLSGNCDMNGDMVVSVQTDQYNHVWIATSHELKEYSLSNNVYRIHDLVNYDTHIELLLSGMTDGQNVFFSGNGGIICRTASNDLESMPHTITPHITSIHNNGEIVEGYILPQDACNIQISFSTFDILNSKHIRYAYRMEGVDNDWVYLPMGYNEAFFNYLPKGKHRFEIKATADDGVWSTEIAEFEIIREPHWWETWWAYVLYSLIGIAIVIVSAKKYQTHVTHKQTELLFDTKELISMKRYIEMDTKADENDPESEEFVQLDKMQVDKARKIVNENLSNQNFDINAFASQMSMSKSTLNRKIRILTGKTPLEFIKDIKMEKAGKMLCNHTASVQDVIIALGYNDYKNFVATFKKAYGMSPTEWQRNNKDGVK